jgi:dihydroorotase
MLGLQFDPVLALSLSRQRHADLLAEVQHEEVVRAARHYAASAAQPAQRAVRRRTASRRTAMVLASLWRTMSVAVRSV